MKKIIFILFFFALYIKSAHAQTPANDKNWGTDSFFENFKYHYYSDFNTIGHLNATFNQECFFAGYGCSSNYSQLVKGDTNSSGHIIIYDTYDQDSNNLAFNGYGRGVATIITKDQWYHPPTYPGSPYRCADSFHYTSGDFCHPPGWGAQKYGYWEMQMREPQYTGTASINDNTSRFGGPTFWLNGGTPYYSEIDIFENYSWDNSWSGTLHYHLANTSTTTYPDILSYNDGYYVAPSGHYPAEGWHAGTAGYWYPPVNYTQTTANDSGWHKIAVDWEPNYIAWYIDDELAEIAHDDYSVFYDGMGILINVGFPGYWTKNFVAVDTVPAAANFPYNYDIDYVKTYKLITDCSNAYSACSFSASTYPWGVKKSIEFTGSSCSTDIASGNNVTLRAVNSVKLDKNFKVEKGATFNIIMQACPN